MATWHCVESHVHAGRRASTHHGAEDSPFEIVMAYIVMVPIMEPKTPPFEIVNVPPAISSSRRAQSRLAVLLCCADLECATTARGHLRRPSPSPEAIFRGNAPEAMLQPAESRCQGFGRPGETGQPGVASSASTSYRSGRLSLASGRWWPVVGGGRAAAAAAVVVVALDLWVGACVHACVCACVCMCSCVCAGAQAQPARCGDGVGVPVRVYRFLEGWWCCCMCVAGGGGVG